MAQSTASICVVSEVMPREVIRCVCRRARPPWVLGGLTAVLLLAGCGSSNSRSTQSSSGPSTRQASTGASTVPRPSVPSSAGAAGAVTGSSGGVTATLHAGTHHPRVQRPWPIRFTVASGGRAARASVSYEYLFAGQVVAHRSHYTFTGHFSDVFEWPAAAVGYQLTFRAVIVSGARTIELDYPVQVIA
jgi:hypothetical protein